eukprot:8516603-Alexandrium_andersonii.AAC.1
MEAAWGRNRATDFAQVLRPPRTPPNAPRAWGIRPRGGPEVPKYVLQLGAWPSPPIPKRFGPRGRGPETAGPL